MSNLETKNRVEIDRKELEKYIVERFRKRYDDHGVSDEVLLDALSEAWFVKGWELKWKIMKLRLAIGNFFPFNFLLDPIESISGVIKKWQSRNN